MKLNIPLDKMELGDKVRCVDGPYGWATVIRLPFSPSDGIKLYRPYVHFDRTVEIEYIGTETFEIFDSSVFYEVWRE